MPEGYLKELVGNSTMKLGNKIEKILGVKDDSYALKLKFTDGAIGTISLAHLFERPMALAAEILKGGMFAMCFVENGALAWPNGFELCPDVLRAQLTTVTKTPRTRKPARKAPVPK